MIPTSLSLGLSDGLRCATENPVDRRRLGRIVRAQNAAEVVAAVAGAIVEPDGIVDPVAYWVTTSGGAAILHVTGPSGSTLRPVPTSTVTLPRATRRQAPAAPPNITVTNNTRRTRPNLPAD